MDIYLQNSEEYTNIYNSVSNLLVNDIEDDEESTLINKIIDKVSRKKSTRRRELSSIIYQYSTKKYVASGPLIALINMGADVSYFSSTTGISTYKDTTYNFIENHNLDADILDTVIEHTNNVNIIYLLAENGGNRTTILSAIVNNPSVNIDMLEILTEYDVILDLLAITEYYNPLVVYCRTNRIDTTVFLFLVVTQDITDIRTLATFLFKFFPLMNRNADPFAKAFKQLSTFLDFPSEFKRLVADIMHFGNMSEFEQRFPSIYDKAIIDSYKSFEQYSSMNKQEKHLRASYKYIKFIATYTYN